MSTTDIFWGEREKIINILYVHLLFHACCVFFIFLDSQKHAKKKKRKKNE